MSTISTGTLLTTAFTVTSDTSGTLTLQTGASSANAVYIDSSQNVGIGSTPTATGGRLQVVGTTNTASAQIAGNANGMSVLNQSGLTIYTNLSGGSTDTTFVAGGAAGTYMAFGIHNATSYSERMRIDSSGNLGLGVTPSAWSGFTALQMANGVGLSGASGSSNTQLTSNAYYNGSAWTYIASAYATKYTQVSGQHQWFNAPSSTGAITFTQAMTLDASGRLQIASTNNTGANAKLVVGSGLASTNGIVTINTANANVLGIAISNWDGTSTTQGPRMIFDNSGRGSFTIGGSDGANNFDICQTWGTPQVRIDSSGNLLVGTTSSLLSSGQGTITLGLGGTSNLNTGQMAFNGSSASGYGVALQGYSNGTFSWGIGDYGNFVGGTSRNLICKNTGAGGVYLNGTSATSWTAVSDETRKIIIEPITDAANKVATLRAVIGRLKTDDETIRRPYLIAQDVQAVLPEAVSEAEDKEGTVLGLSYTEVIPLLVAAIKEQQALIQSLTDRLTALENK